jgi:Response regulator containing a CheY-like receiver domain and an HTH DNA-binding domain
MTRQRKWTKEGIEAYLALHPKITVKEMAENAGVGKQRMSSILRSFDIKLPGNTGKAPIRKGSPHNQRAHIRQELVEPSKGGALASFPKSRTRLIVVTPCSDGQLLKVIKSGATAYLARETAIGEMGQLAHAGDSMQIDPLKGRAYRLTKREIEVLRHVANGKTYSQIGKALGLSEQTVKNHMFFILRKLGANNKAHATMLALRYGILSLNGVVPNEATKQSDAAKT